MTIQDYADRDQGFIRLTTNKVRDNLIDVLARVMVEGERIVLEQVYATILYYLRDRETVGKYFANWLEWSHQQRKAQEMHPDPVIIRLRERIAKYGTDPAVYDALRAKGLLGSHNSTTEAAKKSQDDSLSDR